MDKPDERRRRFFPTVSLGSVVATLAFAASGAGIYTQVIADVSNSKTEIANIKQEAVTRQTAEKESRQEMKQDIREVRGDVKELNVKVDRVLQELVRQGARANSR